MDFQNNLEKRKLKIVKLLMDGSLAISLLASFSKIYILVTDFEAATEDSTRNIFSAITFSYTLGLLSLRIFYVNKYYKRVFIVVLATVSMMILITNYLSGLDSSTTIILLVMMIASVSIVLNTRLSVGYSILMIFSMAAIEVYNASQDKFISQIYDFPLISIVVLMTLLFGMTIVVAIGYSEIDHSYQNAFEYAKQLEQLNKELDKKVELRTKQLRESFQKQMDSVHSAAVMGGITKSVIHDLATPISSLRGAFSLLDKKDLSQDNKEMVAGGEEAVEQVIRILENGRNIMAGKIKARIFSPFEFITMAIHASKGLLQKDSIKVSVDVDPFINIKGYPEVFERLIVNLLINAVEELRNIEEDREISITSSKNAKSIIINVEDNGRGIDSDTQKKLFDPDFSTKDSHKNLGFGLPFVKYIIEKDFSGHIELKSEPGSTIFSLVFPLADDRKKADKHKADQIITQDYSQLA